MALEDLEIARRLGVDQVAEGVRPAGDRPVDGMVGGELEEQSDRRPALVELAGRMEESGPVAGRRRLAGSIPQERPDPGNRRVAGGRLADIGLEAEVGVRLGSGQVAAQDGLGRLSRPGGGQVPVADQAEAEVGGEQVGRSGGDLVKTGLARLAMLREELAGQDLGLLDVRLVERVDPQDRPGDRGRELPANELAGDVDRVREGDPDDGMAGRRELLEELVGGGPVGSGRRVRPSRPG